MQKAGQTSIVCSSPYDSLQSQFLHPSSRSGYRDVFAANPCRGIYVQRATVHPHIQLQIVVSPSTLSAWCALEDLLQKLDNDRAKAFFQCSRDMAHAVARGYLQPRPRPRLSMCAQCGNLKEKSDMSSRYHNVIYLGYQEKPSKANESGRVDGENKTDCDSRRL